MKWEPTEAYRKKDEGLRITEGKKEGINRRTIHLYLAIAYGKGVVMCEQFLWKYNGGSYSKFVRKYFPATFVKANNSEGNFFER